MDIRTQIQASSSLRFITATSLFDGHDAAINVMRRILQSQGVEVIHLGHNRSVETIVNAAIQEDASGIAVSSYQGGHLEFFKFMIDLLKLKGAPHIKVFGGGGGVIIPREIAELMDYGVARIYSPEDGRIMGLEGMIADMAAQARSTTTPTDFTPDLKKLDIRDPLYLGRCLTWIENHIDQPERLQPFYEALPNSSQVPVIGLTGTGGAGKSCLTDELVRRFLLEFPDARIGIISVDPTKRKTQGALLGDRLRMNAIDRDHVFMRSFATRRAHHSTSAALDGSIRILRSSGADVILVETAGIGQSDSDIADLADLSVYVMTPEFGAPTQLEKIDMLDFADFIVINKFDKPGAQDALRAVRKQYERNHKLFGSSQETFPVFGTMANLFNDSGTDWFYTCLVDKIIERKKLSWKRTFTTSPATASGFALIPANQKDYLRQIAATVRGYKATISQVSQTMRECYQLYGTLQQIEHHLPSPCTLMDLENFSEHSAPLIQRYNDKLHTIPLSLIQLLQTYWTRKDEYAQPQFRYQVRGKTIEVENFRESLSGLKIPKIAAPRFQDWGDLLYWLGHENFPGEFPFTAGVFPFKREGEDPTRMFAGEGIAERTNRRFHYLSKESQATRLSTAFDSVTLYGDDPDERPDIFGKIGNSGVSISTVDDAKRLYSGFNLCDSSTSVSLTINGPAPMILAFFLNAAIDQQVERYLQENGKLEEAKQRITARYQQRGEFPPVYRGDLPEGHNQLGLHTLGISGDQLVPSDVYQTIKERTLSSIRGTVQADILKEDQAQNTCIFSTEFAMRLMGDIQDYFTEKQVKNFYSVSISGYHIAEAGANPITQTAFTLANGFTLIEYYLARGMNINDFAHNLSFFFSNGMDPEYTVIGRVARRIFALALRDRYRANERCQKLKYHIQTSGRSLHAQEIDFNDIRTTIQALYAIYDNCNSLHTNAYDEAITTPTEDSVRRAVAIQMIINRESGLAKNENPLQGSFIIEELTELVEEAILSEFIRISERGGVLGAMETMYQRTKIQEESYHYETLKHSGLLPVIGVNTFINPHPADVAENLKLARSTDEEKNSQIESLKHFHHFHEQHKDAALNQLRQTCLDNGNLFASLMEAVKVCSLGQISEELYRLGGQYRRNM